MEGGGKNVAYIAAAAILGYLFNYNTVEMILLFCCCLIALSGIMFESGRLQTSSFSSQSNAIAAFVILIIILSILYCTHLLSSLLPCQIVQCDPLSTVVQFASATFSFSDIFSSTLIRA